MLYEPASGAGIRRRRDDDGAGQRMGHLPRPLLYPAAAGKSAEQSDFILETIQGFSTIKSAGLASLRKGAFAQYALSLFTCRQKQKVYEQIKGSIYQLIGSLEMVFFMLLALPLLKSGALSLGSFLPTASCVRFLPRISPKSSLPFCKKPAARDR